MVFKKRYALSAVCGWCCWLAVCGSVVGDDATLSLKEVEAHHLEQLEAEIEQAQASLKASPDDPVRAFRLARAWYYYGLTEDTQASERAQRLLEQLHQDKPNHTTIQAYLGSCLLLESARTWRFWAKQRLADDGLALLDEALVQNPDDVEARFVRAATTHHLPFWFNRSDESKADFARLAREASDAVGNGVIPDWMGAAILFHHAQRLEKAGEKVEAKSVYEQAFDIAPQSPAGVSARDKAKALP